MQTHRTAHPRFNHELSKHLWQLSALSAALALAACGGGSGTESTQPPPPVPDHSTAPALDLATAYFSSLDKKYATEVPNTSTTRYDTLDSCYLDNGSTKAFLVAAVDIAHATTYGSTMAIPGSSDLFRLGQKSSDVTIVAERTSTNPDGSTRREIDVTATTTYADGSVSAKDASNPMTLITGSSAGSKMADGTSCATPTSSATVREIGNRKLVSVAMRSENRRNERYSLSTGIAYKPDVTYDRYVQIVLSDPSKLAQYAVVTGPGLRSGGYKLLSPRLLRDDPTLTTSKGRIVNAADDEHFSVCSANAKGGFADATVADCAQFGTVSSNSSGAASCPHMPGCDLSGTVSSAYGWFGYTATTALEADAAFSNLGKNPDGSMDTSFNGGFITGGVYTFKIYNDDGWKTVNGQAGKKPIATYTATLPKLPYSMVQMLGSGTKDLFPVLSSSDIPADIHSRIFDNSEFNFALEWTKLGALPDNSAFAPAWISTYKEGKTDTNTSAASAWPLATASDTYYFRAGADSRRVGFYLPPTLALSVKTPIKTPTFAHIQLRLTDRKNSGIVVRRTYD